jgi:hypothetical protein
MKVKTAMNYRLNALPALHYFNHFRHKIIHIHDEYNSSILVKSYYTYPLTNYIKIQ